MPTPQSRQFNAGKGTPRGNPPPTPGPPAWHVVKGSAAWVRLNAEPLVMVPCKCPMAGSVAMEGRRK